VRLVVLTDLAGTLEPCGCQSRPLGGLDRIVATVRDLQRDAPVIALAAGDLFFGPDEAHAHGPPHDTSPHVEWRAETLARGLAGLRLVATPGSRDVAHASSLPSLAEHATASLLGAGTQPAPHSAIARAGGLTVGVLAIEDDALEAIRERVAALRARSVDAVVALSTTSARNARRIASGVDGIDFLVLGAIDRAQVVPPERVRDTVLLTAGKHGHGVVVVDLFPRNAGPWTDASEWTREHHRAMRAAEIETLSARIAQWKRQPNVDAAGLAQQRARLTQLRSEQSQRPAPVRGNAFVARYVELGPEARREASVTALLAAHARRLNQDAQQRFANERPAPVAPGTAGYVGSERCGNCHDEALRWWHDNAHGHAYATLERLNKQFHPDCAGCHLTGYRKAGGSTLVHNDGLRNVGCESCHGPGSLHVDAPSHRNIQRVVAEATCKQCHNPEHSDLFEYATYRARLIAPGHGRAQ
jgi:hypothetical protein